jgi:hypothetical protein
VYDSNTAKGEGKHENHERGQATDGGSPDCHGRSDPERSHRTVTLVLVSPMA